MIFNMIGESGGSNEPPVILGQGMQVNTRTYQGISSGLTAYDASAGDTIDTTCLFYIDVSIDFGGIVQTNGGRNGTFELGQMPTYKKTSFLTTSLLHYAVDPDERFTAVHLCDIRDRLGSSSSTVKYYWKTLYYDGGIIVIQNRSENPKEDVDLPYRSFKLHDFNIEPTTFKCQYTSGSSSTTYYRNYVLSAEDVVNVSIPEMPYLSSGTGIYKFYGYFDNMVYTATNSSVYVSSVEDTLDCYVTYDFETGNVVDYSLPPTMTYRVSNTSSRNDLTLNSISKTFDVFKIEKIQ